MVTTGKGLPLWSPPLLRLPSLPWLQGRSLLPSSSWFPGPGWFSGASKLKPRLHLSYLGGSRNKANSGTGCLGPRPAGGQARPLSCPPHNPSFVSGTEAPSHCLSPGTVGNFPWDYWVSKSYRIFENSFSYQITNVYSSLRPVSTYVKKILQGLPWWHSGLESACQCRGHGFEPWSGKIPHAAEQLSPCTTTTEPTCHNYRSLHA